MRKLLFAVILGLLFLPTISLAQYDRIPDIKVIYNSSDTYKFTGVSWRGDRFAYYLIDSQSQYNQHVFKIIKYDTSYDIITNIFSKTFTTSYSDVPLTSCSILKYVNESYVKIQCYIYHSPGDTSYQVNLTFNGSSLDGSSYVYESTGNGKWFIRQLSNLHDNNYWGFLPTIYKSSVLRVIVNDTEYTLSVPSSIIQIFETWAFYDISCSKYFVFMIANHQSYAGHRYLYVLEYDSGRNYITVYPLFTAGDVSYMIPYYKDGSIHIIMYDYTNENYVDITTGILNCGIVLSKTEAFYQHYLPEESIGTISFSVGSASSSHTETETFYSDIEGSNSVMLRLKVSGTGGVSRYGEINWVKFQCINGTVIQKGVGYRLYSGTGYTFVESGCKFSNISVKVTAWQDITGGPVQTTTVETYVGFGPQEYMAKFSNGEVLFDSDVKNLGNVIFESTKPKVLTLSISPKVGDSETVFTISTEAENLVLPYNMTVYAKTPVDTEYWEFIRLENYDSLTWSTTFMGGQTLGDYYFYAVATDSEGDVIQSNLDYFTINETISPILPFNISVSPKVGNENTTFYFNTTNISGGVPPYYVYVTAEGSADKILVCTLNSAGECHGTFTHKYSVFGTGYANVIGLVYDSRGFWVRSTNSILVYFNVPQPGAPLQVILTSLRNTTTDDLPTVLCLNISGGLKPYKVTWYDNTKVQCANEEFDFDAPFEICERVFLSPGEHIIYAYVTSADGQGVTSNRVDINVTWSTGRTYNVWIDCIGELGSGVTNIYPGAGLPSNITQLPPPTYNLTQPFPGVNTTALYLSGYGWVIPFATPLFWVMVGVVGLGAAVEYYAKSGGIAFALTIAMCLGALWYLGALPPIIAILLLVLDGLFIWYLFSKLGGE